MSLLEAQAPTQLVVPLVERAARHKDPYAHPAPRGPFIPVHVPGLAAVRPPASAPDRPGAPSRSQYTRPPSVGQPSGPDRPRPGPEVSIKRDTQDRKTLLYRDFGVEPLLHPMGS